MMPPGPQEEEERKRREETSCQDASLRAVHATADAEETLLASITRAADDDEPGPISITRSQPSHEDSTQACENRRDAITTAAFQQALRRLAVMWTRTAFCPCGVAANA
jgi:hypothetical protein